MKRPTSKLTVVSSALLLSILSVWTSFHIFPWESMRKDDCKVIVEPKEPTYPWQTIEFNSSASIPFHLWQTYATDQIPKQAAEAVQSWKNKNPDMPISFHDDEMAGDFILENFGNEIYDIYKSFPVGAMRSDFWRYAVIYMKGGIYGDIDTSCQRPVAEWLPGAKPADLENYEPEKWEPVGGLTFMNLKWSDCSIIISAEKTGWFVQWAFAGVPGHPILRSLLELIIQRAKNGINPNAFEFVHFHTGPTVWADAIRSFLGYNRDERWPRSDHVFKEVWTDPILYRRARSAGVCIMDRWFFGDEENSEARVGHLFASFNFDKKEYSSWRAEAGGSYG